MTKTQDLEDRLEAMFAAQAEALAVPERSASDRTFVSAPPATSRWPYPVVVAAALAALLGAASLVRGSSHEERVETVAPASGGATAGFTAETNQVSMAAQAVAIEVEGKTFSTAQPLEVSSDPGMRNEYTTLELAWQEHGVRMMWNIYFVSDGREWWSKEIRTYDGRQQGEWITYTGEFFRRPLGTPFEGNLDVQATDHGVAGRLRLVGLRLQAFRPPAVCVNPTAPLGLDPGIGRIDVQLAPEAIYGVAVELLDTATCQPAAGPGADVDYRWTTADPAVAAVQAGGRRADVRGVALGATAVRVAAVHRASGQTVAETEVPVRVLPADGVRREPAAGASPPTP